MVEGAQATTILWSDADYEYIRSHFVTLEEACLARGDEPGHIRGLQSRGLLPRATSELPDGTEMVPGDFFDLLDSAGSLEVFASAFRRPLPARREGIRDRSP